MIPRLTGCSPVLARHGGGESLRWRAGAYPRTSFLMAAFEHGLGRVIIAGPDGSGGKIASRLPAWVARLPASNSSGKSVPRLASARLSLPQP
jgi:hypothetical protein